MSPRLVVNLASARRVFRRLWSRPDRPDHLHVVELGEQHQEQHDDPDADDADLAVHDATVTQTVMSVAVGHVGRRAESLLMRSSSASRM